MDDLLQRVAKEVYEWGVSDHPDRDDVVRIARAAVIATLDALADEYVRLEGNGDISSAGWIMDNDGWTEPDVYLRERAQSLVK